MGELKINLGCGYRKIDGFVNIDNRTECSPDLLCDISKGLPFEDNSIDYVRAYDILEHLHDRFFTISEIYRVLKNSGIFEHYTPSTDGRGAFQDFTHVSHWNINSWLYYCEDAHRNLYSTKIKFDIKELKDISSGMGIVHTYGVMVAVK